MKLKLSTKVSHDEPLTPVQIVINFFRDTLLIGAIYILFILVTVALKYTSHILEDSSLHYKAAVSIEYAIFYSGSLVVLAIMLYLTIISLMELKKSFVLAMDELK